MTFLDIIGNSFITEFTGSYLLTGVLSVGIMFLLLLFLRAKKSAILGFALLFLYGLLEASILPAWAFFIVILGTGLDIGRGILVLIFSHG